MTPFIFCILLFALLDGTRQELLRGNPTTFSAEISKVRILELDNNEPFFMLEAMLIQFGDWKFWATTILFVGIACMAYHEKCLNICLTWVMFGAVLFASYMASPLVVVYGVYCFRAQILNLLKGQGSHSKNQYLDSGTEMKEHFIPKEPYSENPLKSSPVSNPPLSYYNMPNDPLAEKPVNASPVSSAVKSFFKCIFDNAQDEAKKALKNAKDQAIKTVQGQAQSAIRVVQGQAQKAVSKLEDKETNMSLPKSRDRAALKPKLEERKLIYSDDWDEEFRTMVGWNHLPDNIPREKNDKLGMEEEDEDLFDDEEEEEQQQENKSSKKMVTE